MSGVRQARLHDVQAIAEVEVETWRSTYAGMLDDDVLIGMSARRRAAAWAWELQHGRSRLLVWEDNRRRIRGFGHCGRQHDAALPYGGEVYTLYVLPDAQGMGIGRQLLLAMFAGLSESGSRSALIWVVSANPSRFFYERMGGRLVFRRSTPVGRQSVETLGYGWGDIGVVLDQLAPSGDRFPKRRRNR